MDNSSKALINRIVIGCDRGNDREFYLRHQPGIKIDDNTVIMQARKEDPVGRPYGKDHHSCIWDATEREISMFISCMTGIIEDDFDVIERNHKYFEIVVV